MLLGFQRDNVVEADTGLIISLCSKLGCFSVDVELEVLIMVDNVQIFFFKVGCGTVD